MEKEIHIPKNIEDIRLTYDKIGENINTKVALGLSGGLDSVTLLHYLAHAYGAQNVFPMSFVYGQRHDIELIYAQEQVKVLGIPKANHRIVDISFLGDIVAKTSAMVSGGLAVPNAKDVSGDKQPPTYVPMRNLIFSSLLGAFAESNDCQYIALGVQLADDTGYWDCTVEFVDTLQTVFDLNRKNRIKMLTPFVKASKSDEIKLGMDLGINYKKTWTSYSGPKTKAGADWQEGIDNRFDPAGPYSVATDASANDRKLAFELAGLVDPIPYI